MATTEASEGTDQRSDWATPWPLFDLINAEFNFTLDAAASPENAKLPRFFTGADDGLSRPWAGERVWLNPPYGKGTPLLVGKAHYEVVLGQCELAACLIVPRSDTQWWHDFAPNADELRVLKGRVALEDPTSGRRNSPQDPSCLVVFNRHWGEGLRVAFWDWMAELQSCMLPPVP